MDWMYSTGNSKAQTKEEYFATVVKAQQEEAIQKVPFEDERVEEAGAGGEGFGGE